MKKSVVLVACAIVIFCAGCSSYYRTMMRSTPDIRIEPKDIEITERLSADATTIRVFGIDWKRLTEKRTAAILGSLYGVYSGIDATDLYALEKLMKENEGYDIVMYPQFEKYVDKPFLGLGFIYSYTNVKVTARMAKLREQTKTK